MPDFEQLPPEQAKINPDWSPPATEAATGIAYQGDFPLNLNLRAHALAKAGLKEDPDGLVEPDLIADAVEQQAAQAEADRLLAAAEAAEAKPLSRMSTAELQGIALAEGIEFGDDVTTNALRVTAIEAARADAATAAPAPTPAGDDA